MNKIVKFLFYYYDYNNNMEIEEDKNKINTRITYTIPPYQYNRIYAYPRDYIK